MFPAYNSRNCFVAKATLSDFGINATHGAMDKSKSYIGNVNKRWKQFFMGNYQNLTKKEIQRGMQMQNLLLEHETGHLLIAELYARLYKYEVSSFKAIGYGKTQDEAEKQAKINLITALQKRYAVYNTQLRDMQNRYDTKMEMKTITDYLKNSTIDSSYDNNIALKQGRQTQVTNALQNMLKSNSIENISLFNGAWLDEIK